jgi:two-component system chemotaxis sensor kinase CheA
VPHRPPRPPALPSAESDLWHLSLRFSPGLFQEGFDPRPSSTTSHPGPGGAHRHPEHPAAHAGGDGPESCYLGFEIRLASAAGKQEIESVFEFVSQDCELRILPPDSRVDDYLRLIEALPADRLRLGEILLACGALTEHELGRALDEQRAEPDAGRAAGRDPGRGARRAARAGAGRDRPPERAAPAPVAGSQMIRVHSDKLDALINRVAELIASASVSVQATRNQDRALRRRCR